MLNKNIEVNYEDIMSMEEDSYCYLDIRNESSVGYGMLPGAIHIPEEQLLDRISEIPRDKKVILYCAKGIYSVECAEKLRDYEIEAYSLSRGYAGWLISNMENELKKEVDIERRKDIERSIQKRYHKELFSPFVKAINKYELIKENDKIAVCISGGKDSMLMAKLFQELKRHNKFHFDVEYVVMDPGYSRENRQIIENNAKLLGIPVTIFESDIFESVYNIEKSPCYLCARMRRGCLYNKAKELGCNKIALGHHYDDVIETILMGMLYGAQIQTMMPKLHSENFEGLELIRPMYLIREYDIKKWRDYNELYFIQCACKFTDTCATCDPDSRTSSKRMETKNLIAKIKEINPLAEAHIFKSVENVNLNTIIAYKENGVKHHFLDDYDKKGI